MTEIMLTGKELMGYKILYTPSLNGVCGCAISAASMFQFLDGSIEPVIIVDDEYNNLVGRLPKAAQFMLMHEIGHIKNGDVKVSREDVGKLIRHTAMELAADAYAAEHYPQGIEEFVECLNIIKGVYDAHGMMEAVDECNARIENMGRVA